MSSQTQASLGGRGWWWTRGNADQPHRPAADHLLCPFGCGDWLHQNNQAHHIRDECSVVGGD